MIQKNIKGGILVNDAVSSVHDPNIARERTFNERLRSLIDKIEDHESSLPNAAPDFTGEDIDAVTAEAIFRKLHGLYYRIQMADDLRSSRNQFNPFPERSTGEITDIDALRTEISRLIRNAGLQSYMILSYSLTSKCYIYRCGDSGVIDTENFILGLKHPHYSMIIRNMQGIIIEKSELINDPFYGRISDWAGLPDDCIMYAVSADSLTLPLIKEINGEDNPQATGFIPSPILFVIGKKEVFASGSDGIFLSLQESLAVPMLLFGVLHNDLPGQEKDSRYSIIDGCVDILSCRKDGCCVVIGCDDDGIEGLYVLRFLAEKCRLVLPAASMVLPVRPRRLVIFSDHSSVNAVEEILSQWDRIWNGALFMKRYNNASSHRPNEMLENILLAI